MLSGGGLRHTLILTKKRKETIKLRRDFLSRCKRGAASFMASFAPFWLQFGVWVRVRVRVRVRIRGRVGFPPVP